MKLKIQGVVAVKIIGEDEKTNNNVTSDKKPIFVALLSVLISLPALIGA